MAEAKAERKAKAEAQAKAKAETKATAEAERRSGEEAREKARAVPLKTCPSELSRGVPAVPVITLVSQSCARR